MKDELYWIADYEHLGFTDFNKEIAVPRKLEKFPEGAVGIRVDSNFWLVALLEYEPYASMPLQDIVKQLWPEVENPSFKEDVYV